MNASPPSLRNRPRASSRSADIAGAYGQAFRRRRAGHWITDSRGLDSDCLLPQAAQSEVLLTCIKKVSRKRAAERSRRCLATTACDTVWANPQHLELGRCA